VVSDGPEKDRLLARRVLGGEEAAFEEFFHDYFPRLYRFALARLDHDADAAEEVVQATLCGAMTSLATFRGEATLFTWLCTLCRREMGRHLKRRGRERRLTLPIEDAPEIAAALESLAASIENSPEDDLRRRDVARLVQATLDFLPARYGDVLEWKYALGLSVAEIALRIGVTPKTVESLLTRAREAFRREFPAVAADRGRPGGGAGTEGEA
jgi:RNA polymerase sigma-70 factor (ECF subfamily)